jgi:predicted nucleic acid-binding protein
MESVYLETSFISYLVASRSRDLVIAAHQQITVEWWNSQREKFDCFISQFVIDEASLGDSVEVQKRLRIIDRLKALEVTAEAEELAGQIVDSGAIPQKAMNDAAHIAVAAVQGIDYILTWNCKHLANAHIAKKVREVCQTRGYRSPDICTPEGLMEDDDNG